MSKHLLHIIGQVGTIQNPGRTPKYTFTPDVYLSHLVLVSMLPGAFQVPYQCTLMDCTVDMFPFLQLLKIVLHTVFSRRLFSLRNERVFFQGGFPLKLYHPGAVMFCRA